VRPLTATYRLQLHAGFGLADVRALLPYLDGLGVSHLYLSPLLRAREGSPHGYDVVDPTAIDPARGGEDDLRRLARDAHARGLGLVLDVVPNHMAASEEGPWWRDVLRRGEASPCARWFDVDWASAGGRIVLPILGDPLEEVLARGEVELGEHDGEPVLRYFDRCLPLAPGTVPDGGAGPDAVRAVLEHQHYELVGWREGPRRLNYRRFFDVDELAGLRVEDPEVFDATHARMLAWVREGLLDGLRVDHVDGMRLPGAYLERLRAALDEAAPSERRPTLHVEKILARDERLPDAWPVDGTTGYDFLADAEDLFVEPDGFARIEAGYRRATRRRRPAAEVVHRAKREVLRRLLGADVRRLVDVAARAAADDPGAPPSARHRRPLRAALTESIVHLRVYRTYLGEHLRATREDRARIEEALRGARAALGEGPGGEALDWLGRVLLRPRRPVRARERELVLRWQQVSGPATAKGVEDTAFYRHVPLASRNEVGAEPDSPPDGAAGRFEAACTARLARWPRSLLAATTHDTKRSADVRARLDVLAEAPGRWRAALGRWQRLARPHETRAGRSRLPDAATRDLVFQTLAGVWPLPPPAVPGAAELAALRERVAAALVKSMREAKQATSWLDPDETVEAALRAYVGAVLDPRRSGALLGDLARTAGPIARAGVLVSLSRLVLQLTAPGVPDVYQGDELWSLLLVDPDNRRPVDYERRRALLDALAGEAARRAADGLSDPRDGRVKLAVLRALLHDRRAHPGLYRNGAYAPLRIEGPRASDLLAFRRGEGDEVRVVVVLRGARDAAADGTGPLLDGEAWRATRIVAAPEPPGTLRCLLGGLELDATGGRLAVADALARLPAAVLAPPDAARGPAGAPVSGSPPS